MFVRSNKKNQMQPNINGNLHAISISTDLKNNEDNMTSYITYL